MTHEEFILLVASLIAGLLGCPVTKYFKEKLNLDSTSSLALSIAVAGAMAVVAMLITGSLGLADFSWEELPATLAAVWSAGVFAYNAITGKRKD